MSQLQRQNGMSQLHDFKDRCATHTARQIHAQTDGPFDPWIHVDSFDLMVVIPTTFMFLRERNIKKMKTQSRESNTKTNKNYRSVEHSSVETKRKQI